MNLIFSNATNTTIQATLVEGDTLGNVSGPAVIFVPVAPGNAEYEAILAGGFPIAPFVAPVAPAIAASAASLQLADAQSLNAQGRTAEAVTAILTIMETPT